MIDFVIQGLFLFSIVSNSKVIRHLWNDQIDVKTLMNYLNRVTQGVEQKIVALLPEEIALAFDGCSCGSEHYVAVFATYESLIFITCFF